MLVINILFSFGVLQPPPTKVKLSWSVNLLTLFLDKLSPLSG